MAILDEYISYITPLGSSDSYKLRATKLGSANVGSNTQPIYLSNGEPVAINYSINASVDAGSAANRAAYYSATRTIEDAASIYMTANAVGVNQTSITSGQTFEVTGKAHIANATNNALTGVPAFSVGTLTSTYIGIGPGGIQAHNNAAASTLSLNYYGGDIQLGSSTTYTTPTKIFGTVYPGVGKTYDLGLSTGNATTARYWNNLYIHNIHLARKTTSVHDDSDSGRLYWYDEGYTTWVSYMSNAAAGTAPTGGQPSTLGTVTSWARRSLIENGTGYGWIWEATTNGTAATNTTTPTAWMALNSNDGTLFLKSNAKILTKGRGLFLTDSSESQYAAIYDNGSNLWVGSVDSSTTGHVGKLYLHAGVTNATDKYVNQSVYVAIGANTTTTSTTLRPIVYKNAAVGTNDGSSVNPIYISGTGQVVASNANIGGTKQFVYMVNGNITATTDTVGGTTKLWYLNSGIATDSVANVGTFQRLVYLNNGSITQGNIVNLLHGGTAIEANTNLATLMTVGNYYCAATADATTLESTPVEANKMSAFTMKIGYSTGTGYTYQELHFYNTHEIYRRYNSTTSNTAKWGGWVHQTGLMISSVGARTLTAGDNIDELTTYSSYYCQNSGTTANLAGTIPLSGSGFKLYNISNYWANYNQQIITSAATGFYFRQRNNSTSEWREWKQMAFVKAATQIGSGTNPVYVTSGGSITASSSTAGSNIKPVYLNAGTLTAINYTINANVSAGTANQVAYYSTATTISSKAPAWEAWVTGSSAGPQAKIQIGNASYTSAAIPSASATASGIVTNAAQTFAGNKTFSGILTAGTSGSSLSGVVFYTSTAKAGKTYINWVKIASFDMNTSNHFGNQQFDVYISRGYTSPAPEVYTLRVNIGWNTCNILQLGSSVNTQIITKFRVARDNTNHKVFLEYYVNPDYNVNENNVYIKIVKYNGSAITALNEVDSDNDSTYANIYSINLTTAGIVSGSYITIDRTDYTYDSSLAGENIALIRMKYNNANSPPKIYDKYILSAIKTTETTNVDASTILLSSGGGNLVLSAGENNNSGAFLKQNGVFKYGSETLILTSDQYVDMFTGTHNSNGSFTAHTKVSNLGIQMYYPNASFGRNVQPTAVIEKGLFLYDVATNAETNVDTNTYVSGTYYRVEKTSGDRIFYAASLYNTAGTFKSLALKMPYADTAAYITWSDGLVGNSIYPTANNTYDLGSSSRHWKALFIGTADSYGSNVKPVYWNAGVPKAIDYTINANIGAGINNAVAYYSAATTISYKTSANGALYATAANGALQWGTLPTAQGGTGNTSYTASRLVYTNTATKFATGTIQSDGDTITFNKPTADIGLIKNIYNSTTYNVIRSHKNGNISISASSVGLYLGYENTTLINFLNSAGAWNSTGLGIGTTSPSYKLHVVGTGYIKGASANSNSASGLTIDNSRLVVQNYGNTLHIGSYNADWVHFVNDADNPFWFNRTVHVNGNFMPYNTTNTRNLGASGGPRWKALFVGTADSYGSNVKPIYWNAGVPKAIDYSINASISAGTANQLAYYSAATTISGTPNITRGATSISIAGSSSAAAQFQVSNGTNQISLHQAAGGNRGIYQNAGDVAGGWLLYWPNESKEAHVVQSNLIIDAGNLYAGTTAATAERSIRARAKAGEIYVYSAGSATGNRGIWLINSSTGTSSGLLIVNQNNYITTHAAMAVGLGYRFSATVDSNPINISSYPGTSAIGSTNYTDTTIDQGSWGQIYYRIPALHKVYATNGNTSSSVTSTSYYQPYWWFRQWSVNTSTGKRTSYREDYSFPACDNNRTSNASYAILTTKNYTSYVSPAANVTSAAATGTTKYYILGQSAAGNQKVYIATANSSGTANTTGVYFQGSTGVLFGAAWNDYAEFRKSYQDIEIEPGRVVKEIGDDSLELTNSRLQRGCQIVSDTYGFAINEREGNKLPLAVAGRVLAYPYESLNDFKECIGWPVCSGPNGTVSIMTEEEEREFPSRIIGTISAVPDYEIWHGGTDIAVNGRVWIKVR